MIEQAQVFQGENSIKNLGSLHLFFLIGKRRITSPINDKLHYPALIKVGVVLEGELY